MHRPGDVLAGRYRLADLLSETEHGRFWLAHDSILGRPVAVHVLDADHPRAPDLMRAARASASIPDQRLLRVLDAESRDGISYVVNEWGRGSSLDVMLARSGPLSPERSAWITAQAAAVLAKAHTLGYAHGRLSPENILIDEAGEVRIIGFAVEAALYGLPEGTAAEDDAALAAILVACLTGTWPGAAPSSVPPTPLEGDHPMRPRQVRAGVPRVLDDLCETALHPTSRGRHGGPVVDALFLHDRLMAYLGAPPELSGLPTTGRFPPDAATDQPDEHEQATQAVSWAELSGDAGDSGDSGASGEADGSNGSGGDATQAGLPSFEDDDSWHRPRGVPAAPPPPLEEPEPKPLFADEAYAPAPGAAIAPEPGGVPGRPPEPQTPDKTVAPSGVSATNTSGARVPAAASWTWRTSETAAVRRPPPLLEEPEPEPAERNRWLPFAFGFVALLLVIAAVLIERQLTSHDDGTGPDDGATPSHAAAPAPITGLTATDFDPFGDPQSENPEDAHFAVDGKSDTSWRTSTYTDQLGEQAPALKSGVGLVLDLHGSYALTSASVSVADGATGISFYVTDTRPKTTTGLKPAATATVTGTGQKVALHRARGRYLVVWLTSLPQVEGGYRGTVAEVALTGTR